MQYADWTVDVSATKTMTCAQVGSLAETATDDDFCTSLKDDFYNTCCLGIRPTDQPTVAPVAPTLSPVATPEPTPSAGRILFVTVWKTALLSLGILQMGRLV